MALDRHKYQVSSIMESVDADDDDNIRMPDNGRDIDRGTLVQDLPCEVFIDAEKSLLRKLNLRILACLWNNIAAAKVAGMQESLHLSSAQYAIAVSILFVGYISMQIPSNIFMAQLRPSAYLPACMAAWGLLSAMTGFANSRQMLYLIRFFLGFAEAAFYPGALFLLSSWYIRKELGFCSAVLYSGSQLGSAFSGLISAGIRRFCDGTGGLEAWRWIFIIDGALTISVAFFAASILPNYPSSTRGLSPCERAVALWRLANDAGKPDVGSGPESWSSGFRNAFRDRRLYMFAFAFLCIQVNSAVTNYFPSIVQTLGFNQVNTLLLTSPPYLIAMLVSLANNRSADYRWNSSFHVMWPLALAMSGFVVAATATNTLARYGAMVFMVVGGHGANAVLLAWVQKTMIRPRIKRACAVAFVNAVGNLAQVFSPYLYPDDAKPRYILAMYTNSLFALVAICCAFVIRWDLLRANHELDIGRMTVEQNVNSEDGTSAIQVESFYDSDHFRYVT